MPRAKLAPPLAMRVAFRDGRWPSGWINTTGLVETAPFLRHARLEFIQSLTDIESGSGGPWGPVRPLGSWERDHLGRGSLSAVPDLPWLDVEQCLPFGGGYYGDDLWLVLDYRPGLDHPRIVVNDEFRVHNKQLEVFWRERAPSFDEFWRMLGLPI